MPTGIFHILDRKDLAALRELLARAPEALEERGPERNTPLMYAAAGGSRDCVRALLEAGARVTSKNEDGHTAAHLAIWQGHEEVLRDLLEAKCPAGTLALDFAVRSGTPGMVRMLLERGVPADPRSQSHLLDAVARGSIEIVCLLLEHGADVNRSVHHATALGLAIQTGRDELIELLLSRGCRVAGALFAAIQRKPRLVPRLLALGADPNEKDALGSRPLETAAELSRVVSIRRLATAGAGLNTRGGMLRQTPLHQAVVRGQRAAARALLELGANPNVTDDFHQSPLQEAARDGDTAMVRILLESGADPNRHRASQPAPLLEAAAGGHLEAVSLLLEHSANPNQVLSRTAAGQLDGAVAGSTPVHLAAARGHLQVVESLLAGGADPGLRDSRNRSAADEAALAGHYSTLQRLRQAGAETDVAEQVIADARLRAAVAAVDAAEIREALAAGANPNPGGYPSPLTAAAQEGCLDAVEVLLATGADPNLLDEWEQSALRSAVVRGHLEVVRRLIAAGADPNQKYADGSVPAAERNTVIPSAGCPLTDAAFHGNAELVELLLQSGADPDLDAEPRPLTAAVRGRQLDIARRLLQAGARPCEEDSQTLALMDWPARAQERRFLELAAAIERECGAAEVHRDLPGVRLYHLAASLDLPDLMGGGDAPAAGRAWADAYQANTRELDVGAEQALSRWGDRARKAGYLLLDGGSPLGCGPMTRILALVPERSLCRDGGVGAAGQR